jgi:hypothetical protein
MDIVMTRMLEANVFHRAVYIFEDFFLFLKFTHKCDQNKNRFLQLIVRRL